MKQTKHTRVLFCTIVLMAMLFCVPAALATEEGSIGGVVAGEGGSIVGIPSLDGGSGQGDSGSGDEGGSGGWYDPGSASDEGGASSWYPSGAAASTPAVASSGTESAMRAVSSLAAGLPLAQSTMKNATGTTLTDLSGVRAIGQSALVYDNDLQVFAASTRHADANDASAVLTLFGLHLPGITPLAAVLIAVLLVVVIAAVVLIIRAQHLKRLAWEKEAAAALLGRDQGEQMAGDFPALRLSGVPSTFDGASPAHASSQMSFLGEGYLMDGASVPGVPVAAGSASGVPTAAEPVLGASTIAVSAASQVSLSGGESLAAALPVVDMCSGDIPAPTHALEDLPIVETRKGVLASKGLSLKSDARGASMKRSGGLCDTSASSGLRLVPSVEVAEKRGDLRRLPVV